MDTWTNGEGAKPFGLSVLHLTVLQLKKAMVAAFLLITLSACGNSEKQAPVHAAPTDEAGLNQVALEAYRAKNYAKAVSYFDQQLEKFPDGKFADSGQFYRGRAHYWLGQYTDALLDFNGVLTRATFTPLEDVRYFKARTYYWLERYPEAITELTDLIGNPPVVSMLTQDYLLYRGKAYFWNGNFVSAATDFEWILTTGNKATIANQDAATFWSIRIVHEKGDFTTARNAYAGITSSSIWYDDARYQIGKTYYDEADNTLDTQIQFSTYQSGIDAFTTLVNTTPISTTTIAANYFLGRSKQKQAGLLQNNPTLITTLNADTLLQAARVHYQLVPQTSSYADDAAYFTLRSKQAQVPGTFSAGFYAGLRDGFTSFIQQFGGSDWLGDANYQIAKLYYDEAQALTDNNVVTAAMDAFDQAIARFIVLTPPSVANDRADSASYFLGRVYQQQAAFLLINPDLRPNLTANTWYDNARNAYANVKIFDPASTWSDNADYRIGLTHYEQAIHSQSLAVQTATDPELATIYQHMQESLAKAISSFSGVVNTPAYITANSADSAQYYWGQSYLRVLEIPVNYRVNLSGTNSGGINFINIQYADARARFSPLVNDTRFDLSNWRDNAYYEIGNTYYQEALSSSTPAPLYQNALTNYLTVINDYSSSVRLDDAALAVGLVYHGLRDCTNELSWMQYTLGLLTASSSITTEARKHSLDITSNPATGLHNCGTSNGGGTTTPPVQPPPVDTVSAEQASFQTGLSLFRSLAYTDAITHLTTHLATTFATGTGEFADDAQFYLGRSLYELLRYQEALPHFTTIVNGQPNSNVYNDSLYWAGLTQAALGDYNAARTYLNRIPSNDPLRDNASYHIAKSYFDESDGLAITTRQQLTLLDNAITQFGLFLADYPTSTFLDVGYYFQARSYHQVANLLLAEPSLDLTRQVLLVFNDARAAYAKVQIASNYYDNAAYQIGRTYYDQTDAYTIGADQYNSFKLAIDQFLLFENTQTLGTSGEAHNALYFLGRSLHQQAALLVTSPALENGVTALGKLSAARNRYLESTAIALPLLGIYNDNNQYYIGRTYYDAAELLVDPAAQFASYQDGYLSFAEFGSNTTLFTSPLRYNARYYLGRARLQQTLLLWLNSTTIPPIANMTVSQTLPEARTALTDTINAVLLPPDHIYYDNALFYLAKSYYDEAKQIIDNPTKVTTFTQAITEFEPFNTPALATSSLYYGAQYYIGRSHDLLAEILLLDSTLSTTTTAAGELAKAEIAYNIIASTSNTTGQYIDNAHYYLGLIKYNDAVTAAKAAVTPPYPLYQAAVTHFERFKPNAVHAASSFNHSALYYLGRTYAALSTDPSRITTALELRIASRTAYQQAVAVKPTGPYADNAQYFLGKSLYDEAVNAVTATEQYAAFENVIPILTTFSDTGLVKGVYSASFYAARANFYLGESQYRQGLLLQTLPTLAGTTNATTNSKFNAAINAFWQLLNLDPNSVHADNAATAIAMIYHDTQLCDSETSWWEYLLITLVNQDPILVTNAKNHFTDLNLPPLNPATHACAAPDGSVTVLTPP